MLWERHPSGLYCRTTLASDWWAPPMQCCKSRWWGEGACPDRDGNFTFLALLWAPGSLPAPDVSSAFLNVTATQFGAPTQQASIALEPPPLLLVHGIWSNAKDEGFIPGSGGLYDAIASQYPHNLIFAVDYGKKPKPDLGSQAFNDPRTQSILLTAMTDALSRAAAIGMAARTVDVNVYEARHEGRMRHLKLQGAAR